MSDLNSLKTERQSVFIAEHAEDKELALSLWQLKKAKASYVINTGKDQILHGKDLVLTEDEIIAAEDAVAAKKAPYGNVQYADPGYQADKKKRYPIDTEEHIRAAWSYINQEKNHKGYSGGQVARIKSRIVSAWKKKIDPKGPPSAA